MINKTSNIKTTNIGYKKNIININTIYPAFQGNLY